MIKNKRGSFYETRVHVPQRSFEVFLQFTTSLFCCRLPPVRTRFNTSQSWCPSTVPACTITSVQSSTTRPFIRPHVASVWRSLTTVTPSHITIGRVPRPSIKQRPARNCYRAQSLMIPYCDTSSAWSTAFNEWWPTVLATTSPKCHLTTRPPSLEMCSAAIAHVLFYSELS